MLLSPWHHTTNAPSRAGIMLWVSSSCPQTGVVLHVIDTGSHSVCLKNVIHVLRTVWNTASCWSRWTPVQALLFTARGNAALVCVDHFNSGPSDDRRIPRISACAAGSPRCSHPPETCSSSRTACATHFWFPYSFAVSVLLPLLCRMANVTSGCASREEGTASCSTRSSPSCTSSWHRGRLLVESALRVTPRLSREARPVLWQRKKNRESHGNVVEPFVCRV